MEGPTLLERPGLASIPSSPSRTLPQVVCFLAHVIFMSIFCVGMKHDYK